MTPQRRLVSAFCLAAVLALSACGSSDGGASDTVEIDSVPVETEPVPAATDPAPVETEPAPTATEPAPTATEPAPVETESAPVETEPAPVETEAAADDRSCLVGDWVITQDEMNAYYDSIEASFAEGPGATFDIVGQVLLTFTETTYVYTAGFDLTLDVAGQSGTGETGGMVTGTWDVVDDLVVTTLGESDLAVVITIGGVTLSGSDFANGLLDAAPINDAAFDCAGPTINFQTGAEGGPGHPVLLTPA